MMPERTYRSWRDGNGDEAACDGAAACNEAAAYDPRGELDPIVPRGVEHRPARAAAPRSAP